MHIQTALTPSRPRVALALGQTPEPAALADLVTPPSIPMAPRPGPDYRPTLILTLSRLPRRTKVTQ
ncbi:hypothetical protein B5M07_04940 [Sulfitobacter sp. D7]|jgi:hypothetical protein|nr:hypothetical protein B5M07_04940 [Sulfitobacter sp. D7]